MFYLWTEQYLDWAEDRSEMITRLDYLFNVIAWMKMILETAYPEW